MSSPLAGRYNAAAALQKILEDESDVSDLSDDENIENDDTQEDPSEENSDDEPLVSFRGAKSDSWKKTDQFLPTTATFSVLCSDAHEARADWKPLDYMMQYFDTDIFKLLSQCTNVVQLQHLEKV